MIAGYTLLGSTYLLIKTTGAVQERAFRQARWAGVLVLGFMGLVTIWTPIHDPTMMERWFSPPRIYFIWAFPLLGLVAFPLLIKSLRAKREVAPFCYSVLLFLAGYLGLQASIYPYAIPPGVTIYEAAAQPQTLIFTLFGVCVVIPVGLAYTAYSYWVFRGKVVAEEGYH